MTEKHPGCYIEVWREKNFQGDYLRLEGPVEYKTLRAVNVNWGDASSSLRVGPHAFLLAYKNQGFQGREVTFGPNQAIADLTHFRLNNEIDSLKVINSLKIFETLWLEEAAPLPAETEASVRQPRPRKKSQRWRRRFFTPSRL